MFDLITGQARHIPKHATLPIIVSMSAQVAAVTAVLVLPALFIVEQMPEVPTMMAFVAAPPPPAPPPPPAAPRPAAAKPTPAAHVIPVASADAAPIEAPAAITAEPQFESDEGVPGGVEGGVPGGVVGGVVGGLPEAPPPPPPAPHAPIRAGGQIEIPALLHRVEPFYPPFAVDAHLTGIVILEAIVERDGTVGELKVLRTAGVVLDREALIAVKQWRYKPLVLNGTTERFMLTVTLSFNLTNTKY